MSGFLAHLSRRLEWAIVIAHRPSSVHPSSVVRPSVRRKLSHLRLLLWNCWTEFNETWQEARSQRPLPSLCFSGRSEKQDGRPGLWLAETFSTSPFKPLNGIQRNLTGSKISTSSTKFVFFGPIGKTRWPSWPLICWDIFDFSSQTAEWKSMKLDRKQDLNVLFQVCVFRADRKNKMATLASDWLRHFWLLLWNRWTEYNETWQEARSQCPLPSLCFSGQSEKQDGRPGLWLAEKFSTSPLKPLNGNQGNLTGSKISTSPSKFVFLGRWEKQDGRPGLWLAEKFSTSPSSETVKQNSTKLDRKQDLNVLYQVCVFRADQKNKMAALTSDWLRHFRLLLWNHWTEFNETWQEARSQRPLPSLCFSGGLKKNKMAPLASDWLRHFWLLLCNRWTEFNETWQEARAQHPLPSLCFSGWSQKLDGRPGLWLAETFSTSPLKPPNRKQRNLTGSKISTSSSKFVFFGWISKQKCPPWPIPQKGGTLYSGAWYVAFWASCLCIYLG